MHTHACLARPPPRAHAHTPHPRALPACPPQVVAHPHYLLATLLLCNAAAMETLPIFLDRLLNPAAAIIISVTAILIFGEILPQAVCKRYGLQVCVWGGGRRVWGAWGVRPAMRAQLVGHDSDPLASCLSLLPPPPVPRWGPTSPGLCASSCCSPGS